MLQIFLNMVSQCLCAQARMLQRDNNQISLLCNLFQSCQHRIMRTSTDCFICIRPQVHTHARTHTHFFTSFLSSFLFFSTLRTAISLVVKVLQNIFKIRDMILWTENEINSRPLPSQDTKNKSTQTAMHREEFELVILEFEKPKTAKYVLGLTIT